MLKDLLVLLAMSHHDSGQIQFQKALFKTIFDLLLLFHFAYLQMREHKFSHANLHAYVARA